MKNAFARFFRLLWPAKQVAESATSDFGDGSEWRAAMIAADKAEEIKFFAQFPVGTSFSYLGTQMVAVRHRPYVSGFWGPTHYYDGISTAVIAEYVDKNGIIQTYQIKPGFPVNLLGLKDDVPPAA